jgi:Ion channel regulatory protein UNC-93
MLNSITQTQLQRSEKKLKETAFQKTSVLDKQELHRSNLKAVLLLSIAFFIMFIAFMSSASIYSKLMRESGHGDMGFYGLALLYFSFSAGCFIAPSISRMIGKP